jgi:hypothetical protein
LPIDRPLAGITVLVPSGGLVAKFFDRRKSAASYALSSHRTQFVLGNVQQTAVLGCMAEFQSLYQRPRHRWLKCLVEGTLGVRVQVVAHERDACRLPKSRLVQEFKEQLTREGVTRIEFRCSPYHQNSALYPIIDHLQRLLQFAREDSPAVKLEKLQLMLNHYRFPQVDTFPLLAALLSLPHPEGCPPLTVSLQKQKEKTQAALVAWLVEEAERQPVYNTWEDVHWADPSTLEVLTLVVDQAPTARLCVLLTFRPEFTPFQG